MTVLVLARAQDAAAHDVARRVAGLHRDVVVASPAALTACLFTDGTGSWHGAPQTFSTPAGIVRATDLGAVLVRIASVSPGDLRDVALEDRAYAASEWTAALAGWLRGIAARAVNPATSACLSGPAWSEAVWLSRAVSLGIPIDARRGAVTTRIDSGRERTVGLAMGVRPSDGEPLAATTTAIGERTVPSSSPVAAWAHRLARRHRLPLLAIRTVDRGSGPLLCGVSTFAPLDGDEERDALAALLWEGRE